MEKNIEIHSLHYDTVDDIIKRFKEYKKQYSGDAMFINEVSEEDAGYGETYTTIYSAIQVKSDKN